MFGPLNPEESARLARLPRIGRARGYRLYALDGTRWLDCWADGGRALMGHRPNGVSLRLKNEIDRGLYAPYPSRWEGRLEKSLMRLFPGYSAVRIYRNAEVALAALGLGEPPIDPLDLPPGDGRRVSVLWGRPLLPGHPEADFLFPVLPLPGLTEVQPVLCRNAGESVLQDPVSPVILAALVRSCASIGDTSRDGNTPITGGNADIWERRGPYMLFRGNHGEYDDVFESLFSQRILVAPSPKRPSILPTDISTKESALLTCGGF